MSEKSAFYVACALLEELHWSKTFCCTGPNLTESTAGSAARAFLASLNPPSRSTRSGRGIVICAGGEKLLRCAWVCVNMLRAHGCRLPIELWQLNAAEIDDETRARFLDLGATSVNAAEIRETHPVRILNGWELKPYALAHCGFAEVLLLDADNVPLVDPEYLFDSVEFLETGAIFWPDAGDIAPDDPINAICEFPRCAVRQCESGQILIDACRHRTALQLTVHINEHSDFYYRYIHGDKDTYQLAWRIAGKRFTMIGTPMKLLRGAMCQHDFTGRRIFQHRNSFKWIPEQRARIAGFWQEDQCYRYADSF